jgi:hypothetical protein
MQKRENDVMPPHSTVCVQECAQQWQNAQLLQNPNFYFYAGSKSKQSLIFPILCIIGLKLHSHLQF